MTQEVPSSVGKNSIWDKVDLIVMQAKTATAATANPSSTGDKQDKPKNKSKLARYMIRFLASVLWLVVAFNLLVFDALRWSIANILPNLLWLYDYKFLVNTVIFLFLFIVFRKKKLLLTYLISFPFVVIFWLIPMYVFKHRNWIMILTGIEIISNIFSNIKRSMLLFALLVISLSTIVLSDSVWLLGASAILLTIYLAFQYWISIRAALKPSNFVDIQRKLIDKLASGSFIKSIGAIKPELKDAKVEKFNESQMQEFTAGVTGAAFWNKGLIYWSYQLEQYRKSGRSQVFSWLGVFGLFLKTLLMLTVINITLFKIDVSNFTYSEPPSFAIFVYYTLCSFFASGVPFMEAKSDLAIWVKILTAVLFGIIFLTFIINFFIAWKNVSQETKLLETINKLKEIGAGLEDRVQEEYEMPLDQALTKLGQAGNQLLVSLANLTRSIPKEFYDRQKITSSIPPRLSQPATLPTKTRGPIMATGTGTKTDP